MSHAARRSCVRFAAAALLIAAAGTGCRSSNTEQYSIELTNSRSEPITVWLTKTGERASQPDWLAPEDLSTSRAASVEKINGAIIPPNKTGSLGPIRGEFGWEDRAVLRIYAGSVSFDQMLATPEDSGTLRLDVVLDEGVNRLVVRGPKLTVDRNAPAATQP